MVHVDRWIVPGIGKEEAAWLAEQCRAAQGVVILTADGLVMDDRAVHHYRNTEPTFDGYVELCI